MSLSASRHRWAMPAVLAVGAASIIAVHAPLIGYKTYANVDEAYAVALASRLNDGFKLYQGAVSQRGPLMYYAYALIARLHGWDNIVALRLWALGFALASFFLTTWLARVTVGRVAAMVTAAVAAYALGFGFPAFDAYALHGEMLQLPALVLAAGLPVLGTRRPKATRRALFAVAGILFGAAVTIKQSAGLHIVPVGILVWSEVRRGRDRGLFVDLAIYTATSAAVVAGFLVHAAAQGTFTELVYYCVTYNQKVHLKPTNKVFPVLTNVFTRLNEQSGFFVISFLVFALLARGLFDRARRAAVGRAVAPLLRGFGGRQYAALHLFVAFATASSMYRFFPHYYLEALPFLAVTTGALLQGWFSRAPRAAYAAFGGVIALLLFVATFGALFGERVDGRVAHDRTAQMVARYVEATTKPTDRVFVWGFSPMIYGYSHRKPAGRYVFGTYVTGFVPWFWDSMPKEQSRIVPGSVEALLGDLDREDPPVVVDAGSVMMARPMRAYDKPNAWLHAKYCFEVRIGAYDVYRKKAEGTRCPVESFPLPHDTITWWGGNVPIPIPLMKDMATTKRLPRGNYMKPLWFPEAPRPPEAGLQAARERRLELDEQEGIDEGFYVPSFDPNAPDRP
ncbi:MAG: hypothetical protein JNL38_00400 [Myxococcales bacterium]|nr:hypothetical protein [Myxococcales bacterium]